MIDKDELKTLPLLIAQLSADNPETFDKGKIYMLMTLAVLPVVVVYLIFSKAILKNLTSGAVKG